MTDQKNLQSIQRIDTAATEVILHCTQAALYEFNQSLNKWKDTDTTGPLFIYRRQNFPFYAIMIANRQSLEDYVEPIVENLNFKYDPPYILIHRADGMIRGLWVYGEDECKRIFNKINEAHKLVINGGRGDELERDLREKEKENVTIRSNKERENIVAVKNNVQREHVTPKKNNVRENVSSTSNNNERENVNERNNKKRESAGSKKSVERENSATNNIEEKEITPEKNNNTTREIAVAKNNNKLGLTTIATVAAETSSNAAFSQQIKTLQNIVLTLTTRIDPFACELVAYFQQATLYEFSIEENRWKKTDTAGPLVVFKRVDFPNYSLLVIDLKMKSDFVQPLDEKLKIEHRAPYIFLSGRSDGVICGIWMPSKEECARFYKILVDLMEEEFGNMGDAVI